MGVEEARSYDFDLARLGLSGVSPSTISTGILDVNNILIHVGQNLVNFLAGSAVWLVLGTLNLGTARSVRSGGEGGVFSWLPEHHFSWMLRTVADTVDIINSFHQEL